jgi:hypothetical protein
VLAQPHTERQTAQRTLLVLGSLIGQEKLFHLEHCIEIIREEAPHVPPPVCWAAAGTAPLLFSGSCGRAAGAIDGNPGVTAGFAEKLSKPAGIWPVLGETLGQQPQSHTALSVLQTKHAPACCLDRRLGRRFPRLTRLAV